MSYQKNNHRSFVLIQPPRCWMYKRWQGTKCFKTIRKRAKPDSNCSCACGALETPESQMQATNKHFHSELMVWGSSVFGIQFGSIYQKGIFQSAGPTQKISKPLSPIHWWWKNRLIQATHNRWTHSPANTNHPSTRCSLGHIEAPKSNPQVGSGANTLLLNCSSYHWVNHNQNTILQESWYSQPNHHMIFGHITESS